MSSVDFIVIGLPRSGTTWLANWLTTDTTICLHDPFSGALPEEWRGHGKRLGISCTGAYLMPSWLSAQNCSVAVIERDPGEVDASLTRMGLPAISPRARCLFATAKGRRWRYQDIWNEARAREIWTFLLPDIAFDAQRYRLLSQMQIQPHMGKWKPSARVARELVDRKLLDMEV